VRINSYVEVRESVVLENVEIGRNCRIRKAIIDKDVYVPAGTTIGYDMDADRERYYISEGGVVVIPKGAEIR
jgi:glucose-1-phosphate adenylyltransferase